jgi:uncharacterized lipoprotein
MRYLLWLALFLTLTACSHSSRQESNRFVKYAATIPPITVPPGIQDPTGESYYPVPPILLRAPLGTKPPLEPPGREFTVYKKVQLPAPQ